nr:immunoglobulin heavy chain junction region [Macaca mulatta]MOV53239.1 immunoglobulin heavy chain junction region [Macaca mulatta]MOV53268.1 immunoglobulin heavy chain junction region [Macaca mulatta]MOV53619.1 immunoglobulin heavy chain junction region [Macaca mulatta]MOV53788.1 immunoglobulin heavy chain junction region [Macaca mulatta]
CARFSWGYYAHFDYW